MKQLRLRRLGFASLLLGAGAAFAIACGDDDSVLLATGDGGVESSTTSDSSTTKDGKVDTDTGSTIMDASADVRDDGDVDAEVDAGPKDAQADVELPPVDAGSPDADAGDLAREFPARVAAEVCQTFARCCFSDSNTQNDAGVDGGHYNQAKCLNAYSVNGLNFSSPGAGADFNKLTYNASKANECLSRLHVLACSSNAAEYRAAIAACYAALVGTIPAGSACATTSECAPGLFCNTAVAGGTCEAIRSAGGACGDWTTSGASSTFSCSNRFSANPPRFCRNLSDAGTKLPQDQWKCDNSVGLGGQCFNDAWCSPTTVCPFDGPNKQTCQDFIPLFPQASCNIYVSP
ncbi:MAG: hypothetical protein U0270_26325 [Labilithrix sp.]